MDKTKENLAKVIRETRESAGLIQIDLPEHLDMNDKTILNIENYRGNPKFDSLYTLVTYLKIPGDKIVYPSFTEDDENKKQLLLEIQSCSDSEAKDLLRMVRYTLELLRRHSIETD